jgi:hypothetical protein
MWEETNEYTDYQPKWGSDKAALGRIAALGESPARPPASHDWSSPPFAFTSLPFASMPCSSTLDLAADEHVPCRVDAVDLKDRFWDIETDRPDRLHAWIPPAPGHPIADRSMPLTWR